MVQLFIDLDLSKYETHLITRSKFRMLCSAKNIDYNDYYEISTNIRNKYFYIHKNRTLINLSSLSMNDSINSITGFTDSLFFSGCKFHCNGCWSKNTWDINNGITYNIIDVYEAILNSKCKNISLLGGSPFYFMDKSLSIPLIKWIKQNTNKFIYVWTGYLKEEVEQWINLELIDVLIDGKFELDKRNLNLLLRGSSNQRLFYKGKQVTEKELLEIVDKI